MGRTIDDLNALLDDYYSQRDALQALHDEALSNVGARSRLQVRLKHILEDQRSALDYMAVAITKQYGNPKGGLVYYPLAQDELDFAAEMDRKMPGVAAAQPQVADAIKNHQPFRSDREWLRELNQLTRQHKHNTLRFRLSDKLTMYA